MFKNYLKIALRNLLRNKGYTFINVAGLAIGIACCLVIAVFVRGELEYDNYHEQGDLIFRLAMQVGLTSSGEEHPSATTPLPWAPAMKRDYPEVQDFVRFLSASDTDYPWEVRSGEKKFAEGHVLYADASVFNIFSWPLIQGDPKTALAEPNAIVVSQAMADKYFGAENPMGKSLTVNRKRRDQDGNMVPATTVFTITGVMKNIPANSHFTGDFFIPIVNLNQELGGDARTGETLDRWFWRGRIAYTYLLLSNAKADAALIGKFPQMVEKYVGDDTRSRGYYYEPFFQPLEKIYLAGDFDGQLAPVGNVNRIYLFSVIAAFILVIACINFMNLSTARSVSRAREVGMRKVIGADRRQLIKQFLGESLVLSFLALLLGFALAEFILPKFYGYIGREFQPNDSTALTSLISLLAIGIFAGLFAGAYPAFVLSAFHPISVLRGSFKTTAKGAVLRKSLVVFQFAISVILIVATLTVFDQLQFMRSRELGFDKEQVLIIPPTSAKALLPHYEAFEQTLLQNPGIADVTFSSAIPSGGFGGDLYAEKGAPADAAVSLAEYWVENNFTGVLGLKLVAGRNFNMDVALDRGIFGANGWIQEIGVMVNEETVRRMGWASAEQALGKQIIRDPQAKDFTCTIIGVIKDFHFESLRESIKPVVIGRLEPKYIGLMSASAYIAVKIRPHETRAAIAAIRKEYDKFAADVPFAYSFLDEDFNKLYDSEEKMSEVFGYVSFLAIFVACLGLFGLAAFAAEQRTKEIGIRKALGATVSNVMMLLSKDFVKLVLVANLLAWPIAYFAMNKWLQDFAYRGGFEWWIFALAGGLALLIAFVTVSTQAIKAALANPVESLRYE